MIEVENYKLKELPNSVYYIPNFITSEEEDELLKKVYSSPKPKWKALSNRRLQNWGGLPHPKGMIQENLPQWLTDCIKKVQNLKIFQSCEPNHVLVNEYLAGQGIMPHEDGPLFYPTIATINLGSHTVLDYYEKLSDSSDINSSMENKYVGSLLLERCSLLIVQDDLYSKYLHGICERMADTIDKKIKNIHLCKVQNGSEVIRSTRISLTIRHVPFTRKAKFLFGIR